MFTFLQPTVLGGDWENRNSRISGRHANAITLILRLEREIELVSSTLLLDLHSNRVPCKKSIERRVITSRGYITTRSALESCALQQEYRVSSDRG